MAKLKCYAVDDEQDAVLNLHYLVSEYCSEKATWIGSSNHYEEAIEFLRKNEVDILFLDINLGEKTGFDLLKSLEDHCLDNLIMVTAYNEYALEAFKYNAVNYLLKPVGSEEMIKVINKLYDKQLNQESIATIGQFANTIGDKLFIPDRKGWSTVLIKDILYLKGEGSYTHIFTENQPIQVVSKSLRYFEHYLTLSVNLLRVQRSFIINTDHIKRLDRQDGGTLEMSDGTRIPISTHQKEYVMKQLGIG